MAQKSGKRTNIEIIQQLYAFLEGKGEIHASKIREIIPSPSDRNILKMVRFIQDQPKIHFKEDGRYTKLYLEQYDHEERMPEDNLLQLATWVDEKVKLLKQNEAQPTVSHIFLLHEYQAMIEKISSVLHKIVESSQ